MEVSKTYFYVFWSFSSMIPSVSGVLPSFQGLSKARVDAIGLLVVKTCQASCEGSAAKKKRRTNTILATSDGPFPCWVSGSTKFVAQRRTLVCPKSAKKDRT